MNVRIAAFLAAIFVFAGAAYLIMKPTSPADLMGSARPAAGHALPESVGRALAARHAVPPSTSAVPLAPRRATLFDEFARAASYRALYDRLHGSAEGSTAEGLYVTYAILRKCATVSDQPVLRRVPPKTVDQRRADFLAALQPDDPTRDKRIAAFEAVSVDKCAGFQDVKVTQAELNGLLQASADAGDPKAKAAVVQRDIWRSRAAGRGGNNTLSESQVGTLEQAVGSKDPEAMLLAGQLLSDPWPDVTVRLGPSGEAVEPRAFYNAWQMLACDYGSACDAQNTRVLDECAYNGHCDATSLPDYLYYYASTPHESQLIMEYESVLRSAVENGDWSQLQVTHGPRLPGFAFRRGAG